MKFTLSEIILLAFSLVTFVIGIHQSLFYGVVNSYWLFMFTLGFLFWFKLVRDKNEKADDQ
ncbi:hypothetical protein SAMN05421780_102346 [Flexibacter flexilis DSM 6793]|uniref:Uncharacterized protein n=1 Tax=Flexibacter flexilis DSM 6793 TaxID=927664 RepID=A0A1I1FW64_9BACT|nr:hypothetical protein [Flexibacter flexilis]SFC03574.1 hypothetical protein SAMN05421780_102346 [Flexibacter flexilis DSM 6793]